MNEGTGFQFASYMNLFLLFFPVLFGAVVALAKPRKVLEWTDRLGQWAAIKRESVQGRSELRHKYMMRPFLWGLLKIDNWTSGIEGEYMKSGIRSGAYMYFASVFAIIGLYAAVLLIALIFVLIALWIASALMGSGEGRPATSGGSSDRGNFGFSLFGNKTERYDENGTIIGYSEEEKGVFGGNYTQHYDKEGRKTGYSEEDKGIFGGDYTQHYDKEGRKSGYSEEEQWVFGNQYTQHYDKEGNKSGYSVEEERIFGGKYTQHYDKDGNEKGTSEKS